MKRWNILYDYCRLPIRTIYFACVLLAIGYLVQNENVNIFYTIRNPYIKLISELLMRIGHVLIINMPLIFMVNFVSKKANSGAPTLIGIVGYLTYLITTMILGSHTLTSTAYSSVLGISYNTATSSLISNYGTIYPLQTGMIGSFMVAFATRYSFLKSRKRSIYSFLSFLDKDSAALIYNIVICALLGFGVALIWPYVFNALQSVIAWIAVDISDPMRLSVYGFLDRTLSILGLGNIIRQPFWYGAMGGTYSNIVGETITGDVNIWAYMPEATATYVGCGRFITPYYVINMFCMPSLLMAMTFVHSNRKERRHFFLSAMMGMLLSIVCGNPLPIELILLFNAPLLLLLHLGISGALFGVMSINKAYLGFNYSGSTISAMPGAFPDYIINARTPQHIHALLIILLVGIIMTIVYFFVTEIYYNYLAFDILGADKTIKISKQVIEASGGVENIKATGSSPFKLTLTLNDMEALSYEKLKRININHIIETRDGLVFEFGSSSTIIRKRIDRIIAKSKR